MAHFVPAGEAGAIEPQFCPETLHDGEGRLLCVPEKLLGVDLGVDGPELDQSVRRAVRRLQLVYHPDRPTGSRFLSRYASTYLNCHQSMHC